MAHVAQAIEFLTDRAQDEGAPRLVLAHGAGAPMDSPFMNRIAAGVAAAGVTVMRFEFPYMRRRREDGRRRAPDRAPVLEASWLAAARAAGCVGETFIGGKSMGGRIASMIADDAGVAGVVCLGFPFHPPGRPDRLRTAHLAALRTPTLIVQGSRDRLGSREEIDGYNLSDAVRVFFLEDGDHSFKPRVRSGHTQAGHLQAAIEATVAFVRDVTYRDRV